MAISITSNFFSPSSQILLDRSRRRKKIFQPKSAFPVRMVADGDVQYDRAKEVKEFDESKIGAKGLLDSGITTIPRFFLHPPETIPDVKKPYNLSLFHSIPVISLSGERSSVVAEIRRAAAEFGFFQITDHGISTRILDRTIAAIRAFNEQPVEVKARYYRRDMATGAAFSTNFDLYHSKAASWRDTLQVRLGPTPPVFDKMPEVCRREVMEWDREMVKLGETLMGMMSEGLGLDTERLKELTCLKGRLMASHYYPYCPQAELTMGLTSHTDPGVLTVVLQNQVNGLQVKYDGAWLDLKPEPGSLIINVGDILQIMSNDEYKSVEHRVVGNPCREPRVSIAVFFNPGDWDSLFGPLPELISAEKPAVYKSFTFKEFMTRFFNKELDGKSLINFFKRSD